MPYNTKAVLSSYIDALRPIIYINHFDFKAVDDLILSVSNNTKIFEYNNAYGDINFKTKTKNNETTLEKFLDYITEEAFEHNIFIVLKDIHVFLNKPEIIARLKAISEKNIYSNNFYATIFIVSAVLEIPIELENYITIVDMPTPDKNEVMEIVKNYGKDLNLKMTEDLISELALDFKGLTEFQIIQILNLAYQDGGFIDERIRA